MTFIDSVTPFLEPVSELIRKLVEADISVRRSIAISHKSKTIDYHLDIGVGTDQSKREKLAEKIQSYFKEPFRMEQVLHFGDLLVPNDSDLLGLGIATLKLGKFELDIGRLIREVRFDIASLKISATIPDDVLNLLVIPTKSSSGTRDENRLKARLEVSLDYAGSWKLKYERFEVKDIEYQHTITVSPQTIGEVITRDFYNRMMGAARAFQTGDQNAARFFSVLNRHFLGFEGENYYARLLACTTTDSEAFEVVEVVPKMAHFDLLPGGPQLLLPGSFKIRFRTRIEGEALVGKAQAFVDIDKLKEIFREMIALITRETRSLSF